MLETDWFYREINKHQIEYVTGVPCSYVSGLYRLIEKRSSRYLSATSEGEGVAIAAGTWLAGSQCIVMSQNSGLGNMVNPLSSLTAPFEIPVLLGVSWRGWPIDTDEPQHKMMGRVTPGLLKMLDIPATRLAKKKELAADNIAEVCGYIKRNKSSALIIEKGTFVKEQAEKEKPADTPSLLDINSHAPEVTYFRSGVTPSRSAVLEAYLEVFDSTPTIATTGYTSRELYTIGKGDNHFYMVGSMGCAVGIGVGVANVSRRMVSVIDGDGAILMKMGSLATAGKYINQSFLHILLDNGQYESTGGQSSNGAHVDFCEVAASCGYKHVLCCEGLDGVRSGLQSAAKMMDGPTFLYCKIKTGTLGKLPRPKESLPDLARNFRGFLLSQKESKAATAY